MQQFMGGAWGLAAAFIFPCSGSLFPLSHFLTVMDLFSVMYYFKDLGQSFFKIHENKDSRF